MMKKIIYTAILTALTAVCTTAQTPAPKPTIQPSPMVAPAPVTLDTILGEATKQITVYRETFRDLLATETKTFENYDKDGELDESSIVESIFLVYRSAKDDNASTELRNILKVDDKPVPESQARADRFLSEVQKTATAEKELEKIEKEGLRYDRTIKVYGYTFDQGIALSENIRPVCDFKLAGTETIDGVETYLISYQQVKSSPYITVNAKSPDTKGGSAEFNTDIPGALKKTDKFLRGKLWIDKQTFQIRREERQLAIQTPTPIIANETIFEYASSEFGILVPKKISFLENDIKKVSKSEDYVTVKDITVNFEYSKFRKTNVEVKILDDDK
jgi:hypothetical protein